MLRVDGSPWPSVCSDLLTLRQIALEEADEVNGGGDQVDTLAIKVDTLAIKQRTFGLSSLFRVSELSS